MKLNNYGSSTGTAGKTYFYKRANTYSNDRNEFTNPKVGGAYPDFIRMGAWGQGARPKINMTGASGHFVSIGTIPWGNAPIVEADVCHNFEIYDFETYNDNCEDVGHFLVKPAGDNIEGHRLKSANTKYQDGLIYLPTSDAIAGNEANRNCRFIDIETNQTKYRGFKIESEGVTVHNNKGYTDNTLHSLDGDIGTEIPCAQAAHRPNVEIKYMVCICDDISPDNLGLQVRAGYQTYQWCYLEGLANALVVYVHAANDGVGGDYNITSTSGFSDIIIKGAKQAGYFGRQGGTTDNPNGVRFERIKLIECEGGFQVAYGAINTLFSYVDASNTLGWGFQVYSHAGSDTRIENGSAMNTFSGSGGLNLDPSAAVVVKNTNYSGLSGSMGAGSANNSTSADIHALNGAGTDLGYSRDIQGNKVSAAPAIGAVEASAIIEKPGGWAGVYDSGKGVQGGAGGEMVECKTWTELWTHIDADEDNGDNSPKVYVYTGSDIVLSSPTVYTINEWHNKTVLALFGQTISGAEIRCVDSTNFIWRNWGRKGPFYPWGTGSGEAELDHFTVNSCEGGWFDYCDMDVNFSYNTTDSQYADGMIDTNLSNYITVSNTRFRNGQRVMLIGYSDTQIANRGLLKISLIYCSFENNASRQPKARFGQIHILNCLFKWNPSYATAVTKPTSSNMLDIDAEAQVYVEGTWFENGGELRRDNDGNSPKESGLKLVNCHIEGFVSSNIGEIRPEKVTWVPPSVANYRYPIPVMTASEAKTHVEDNAGTNWHLLSEAEDTTHEITTSVSGSGTVSGEGTITEGENATLTATPATGYIFKRWEEDSATVSTANPYVFSVTEDRALTAVFVRVYENTLTVSPSGAGTASESPAGPHENGTSVTLTASPAAGKRFVRWSVEGDLFSTENPHSYFVAGYGYDLVAEFEDIPKWDVTLSANPPEGGTVEEITSGPYAEDEDFEIEATPAPGYRFVDWTIYGLYFYDQPYYEGTMGTEDLPLVANFELIPTYTVTIEVTPEGGGTVEEITTGPYETGEIVQLRATAAEGYRFVRWKNGAVEQTTNPEFNFNMGGQNLVLTAEFEESAPVFFSLSVVSSPGLAGSVTGSGDYEAGDKVPLMATNNTGWTFLYWMQDGEVIAETKSFEFTMPAENATVYAFSELTGSMANARVEPEQVPEPLAQPEPQEEEAPEEDVLRGIYKLNNIDLAERFGFIPRQSGNTNLAISGCWDMPERIGKTFHDWEDQDGIEPYVAGPEIRWSGRDILLTGLLKGDDQADGLAKLYDLYAHISALDSVALLECELGSWNVMVNGEVKAEHISEGWYLVDIPFRQPVVYINAPVVEPSDLGNELGIDSRSFADLGFIFLRLEQSYNRPAPKGLTITSWPYESERVNKIEAREIKLQGVFLSPDYSTFKNRLNGLYSLLAQPGLRSIIVDGQVLHRVFVKDGVQVQDVRITGDGQVTAVITINFTEGEASVINWDYLADAEGNIILNDEGNKLLIIPDDTEVVMDQFLADGFGQLILTKEGEKIVIKK